jgi:hypothetical protein
MLLYTEIIAGYLRFSVFSWKAIYHKYLLAFITASFTAFLVQ